MTPETKARHKIDQKLETAGWVIQDMKELKLADAIAATALAAVKVKGITRDENFLLPEEIEAARAERKNIRKATFSGQLMPQDPNDETENRRLERIRAGWAERGAVKKPRECEARETA